MNAETPPGFANVETHPSLWLVVHPSSSAAVALASLSPEQIAQVQQVVAAAIAADGARPLSEAAELRLRSGVVDGGGEAGGGDAGGGEPPRVVHMIV